MRQGQEFIRLRQEKSLFNKIVFVLIVLILIFFYGVALFGQEWQIPGSRVSSLSILYRMFIAPFTSAENFALFGDYIVPMFETIAIAYAGGIAASLIAVPIGFLASRNIGGPFNYVGKAILNGIRSIPSFLFAVVLVAAISLGPFPGVIAISVNSIGMIGKLYAEIIESIDMNTVNAIRASGGNRIQAMWYGVLPQVLPDFISASLYRFEIDVRASTVLGIVGAGGIGIPLDVARRTRNWEGVGAILIIVIIFVTLIDFISGKIRSKLV